MRSAAVAGGRGFLARVVLPGLIVAGVPPVDGAAADGSGDEPAMHGDFNNGEDTTRPVNLFQIRERYQRLPDAGGLDPEKWVTTLRADLRADLAGGWKIYGRIDEPLVGANDVTSRFDPNGHARFGQGDLLTELALIAPPPAARFGWAGGVRAVWPTAGLNQAGDGKYQVGPVAAVRWSLPEIAPGSFVLPQVVWLNSVASRNRNSARPDIDTLEIQPKVNIALPRDWFLTAWASENIEIDYNDDGKLFVPLDLMLGKKLFDVLVVSLEYSRSMFHEEGFEPYQWQLEGRVGYYF